MGNRKATGVDWLGHVPSDWALLRIPHAMRTVSRSYAPEYDLLSVYLKKGVIPYSEGGGLVHKPSEDLTSYQHVAPGDVVMNNQQAWRGSVGVSSHHGNVSPAYLVARPTEDWDSRFLNYLLRSPAVVSQLEVASRGVGDIQRQLSAPWLRNVVLWAPPPGEQRVIADFLDRETARIDELIAKQERLLVALVERRRAVLSRSVRFGVGTHVLRESGSEWLGRVPSTWSVSPVWAVLKQKRELVGENWSGLTLLSLSKKGVIARDLEGNKGKFPESFEGYQLVEPNDLVFCHFDIEETPRTVGLVRTHGMLTGAYTRYAVLDSNRHDPAFLAYLFEDIDNEKRLRPFYTGMRNTIQKERFASLRIALPELAEQRQIVQHIEQQTREIDVLMSKASRANDLLLDRRKSLIDSAVTGKLRIRG